MSENPFEVVTGLRMHEPAPDGYDEHLTELYRQAGHAKPATRAEDAYPRTSPGTRPPSSGPSERGSRMSSR